MPPFFILGVNGRGGERGFDGYGRILWVKMIE